MNLWKMGTSSFHTFWGIVELLHTFMNASIFLLID